jgi:hypothetical protein
LLPFKQAAMIVDEEVANLALGKPQRHAYHL